MLDEFVWGKVSPNIARGARSGRGGLARETATRRRGKCRPQPRRIHRLRARAGMVGRDSFGAQLRGLLAEERISHGLPLESAAPTIVKTRIIARQQQVVRVDREKKIKPDPRRCGRILAQVERVLPETDAIIFEDYARDCSCRRSRRGLQNGGWPRHRVTVDPNPGNPLDWSGITAIKPKPLRGLRRRRRADGRSRGRSAPGRAVARGRTPAHRALAGKAAPHHAQRAWDDSFRDGQPPYHTPTRAQEVFDVSGRGDTAISLYTLALAAGATAREAAEIANHASESSSASSAPRL